ncbi:hypothetical protein Tco_0960500, partial [Tanacetum coccineum]
MQGVKNTEDALINIIKSIKKEMKDDIMKKKIKASTANIGNETSSIASNKVDTDDDNTYPTTSCLLPKELSQGSFLLPFNIDNDSLYAITTLEAKHNTMLLDVYKYLGLDRLRDVGTGGLRMWICFHDHERRTVKGSYIGFADFLQLPIRPRPCNYSFEEWLKIRMGHNNLHESDREFIFNEWILDSYDTEEEYAREIGYPYSRRFDEYNRMFKNEIKHLSNEYNLRIGKKGLTQENQTPKKIEDMTMAEYVEYEKKMNINHIINTKTYLPTYFSKRAPTHDPIREFANYFGPNQPGAESNCDSEDMEEEVEYMTDDEVVMSEKEESNHGNTQNIQHFKEKDDVDKWLNTEITKHLSMQGVKNTEDALISIIKSIKKEMKDDIMKKQNEASIANIGNETSSIASNEVDTDDDNTSPTASYLLPKKLSPGSFLLPFNIDNHSLYAITTLEAKVNIMSLDVYEYLGLDKLRDVCTVENTTGTNEPIEAIDIL